ncbi:MAG: hypothetical protein ACLFNT_02945 [Spirochaetales bacterium]
MSNRKTRTLILTTTILASGLGFLMNSAVSIGQPRDHQQEFRKRRTSRSNEKANPVVSTVAS